MGVVTAQEAIVLLDRLIATPSHSREENATADILEAFLRERGIDVQRIHNNVWAKCEHFDAAKPTLLLNSHHDTVKPSAAYTIDPYKPLHADSKIYGLGSNDAGGPLVSLIATFLYLNNRPRQYNLVMLASCEEEVSGKNGIESVIPLLPPITVAIVGEPTNMQPAIAEKGLMVPLCRIFCKNY